jgi:DNA polymerase-3 subunit gamma/tau
MLLKGLQETRIAPDPAASAEMTLIRIAHSADLPPPADIIRGLRKNAASQAPDGKGSPAPPQRAPVSLITTQQVVTQPVMQGEPEQALYVKSFAEAVEMFHARREALLHNYLMREVRLVRFEQGRVELNICGEVPLDFAGRVGKNLSDWTKTRWVVILSREQGDAPLQVQRDEEAAKEREAIKSHPLVAKVLESFPGAEVVKITNKGVYT